MKPEQNKFVSGLKRTKKRNKGTCESHIKNKKKIKKDKNQFAGGAPERKKVRRFVLIFFLFFSLVFLRFTETCSSEFIGVNTESALRDKGYA